MYYVYRISSSYDGFTPKIIESRLTDRRYLVYNWNQYYDQLERGDFVFTFFTGKGVQSGIYLISKIVELKGEKKAKGKVISYDMSTPIVPTKSFYRIKDHIFTRPRGSVFIVPPTIEPFFDKVLSKRVLSDIEIFEKVNCGNCPYIKDFRKCPIFSRDYLINWKKEVVLHISGYEGIISPFWILPRQSWWMKLSYAEHVISRIFYAFKSGYELYTRLFAEGIVVAIENSDDFSTLNFDYIVNIPLSPDKKASEELDRVNSVCKILSSILHIPYISDALVLSNSISRREWKHRGWNARFLGDYFRFLKWQTNISFDGKNILIVDDVITDGMTLKAIAKKIHKKYPRAKLYAATCGIMAKRRNMTPDIIRKYEREYY